MSCREFNKKYELIGGMGNMLAGFVVFIIAFIFSGNFWVGAGLGAIVMCLLDDSVL